MVRMDARDPRRGQGRGGRFRADGGTAMGTWLTLATRLFAAVPSATQRHAILLTDGYNQHETPEQLGAAIEAARGRFQCDCRGVGSDWQVAEVRKIATALLGSVDLIAEPDQMAADFEQIMRQSMGRGVAERGAARVGAAGVPGALRAPGVADRRGPHHPAAGRQRVDRGLPDRRLG